MDIGPRGGGKTTKAVELVQLYKECEPEVRRVTNVPIENAYYVPNILKFLATKLIAEGAEKPYAVNEDGTIRIVPRKTIPAKMQVTVDETAISGLEARGSGTAFPLNTYLLALSRKLNVDIELISQLMSMVDKRPQWLSDFYTLCEKFPADGYFQYRNYDSDFRKTSTQRIYFDDAEKHLFPKFDTTDIPNYDDLSLAFKAYYQISEDDMTLYEDIKQGRKHIKPPSAIEPNEIFRLDKKSLRAQTGRTPGETVLLVNEATGENKRYEIIQKDWLFAEGKYRYRMREVPDYIAQTESMDDAGMEPIEENGDAA